MKAMRLQYPIPPMSRVLEVSVSGYYAWLHRPLSKRAQEEARLELEIKAAHKRTRQTYGPERLQHDLVEHGIRAGVCRIKRIRKKLGIRCKQTKKFKVTTDSKHSLPVAENLLNQQFEATAPNQLYVTDITYIPTAGRLVVSCRSQGSFYRRDCRICHGATEVQRAWSVNLCSGLWPQDALQRD